MNFLDYFLLIWASFIIFQMADTRVGETNRNKRVNINKDTTNPITDAAETQTNTTRPIRSGTSETKKRKAMSLSSDIQDHYIKWD